MQKYGFSRPVAILFYMVMFFFLSLPSVFAQDCNSFVETVGRAAVVADPATVRDRALIDARVKAIEKCGVMVEERSITNMGMTLDHFAQIKAFAFVKSYDIIKEWQKNDTYFVKIKAWVKQGKAEEKARKALLSSRLVIMLADGEGSDTLESIMKEKLANAGFSLLDNGFIKSRVSDATWQCVKTGNISCVGKEFYPFLANYLIRIKSRIKKSQNFGEGILSFSVNSEISCTQISTALMKPYSRKYGVVFGRDLEQVLCGQSINQFEKKIAEPLASEFMKKLSNEFGKSKRDIKIKISGLANKDDFENFKLLVKELRWVGDITNESYHDKTGYLSLPYTERAVYLASMIAYRSIYKVTRYTWDQIDVVYQSQRPG